MVGRRAGRREGAPWTVQAPEPRGFIRIRQLIVDAILLLCKSDLNSIEPISKERD